MRRKKTAIIIGIVFAVYAVSYLVMRCVNYAEISKQGATDACEIRGKKYLAKERLTCQTAQWVCRDGNAVINEDHVEYNLDSSIGMLLSRIYMPMAQLDYFITGTTTWRAKRTAI